MIIGKKYVGPSCKCKLNCFEKVDAEAREKLFHKFWKLGNYDIQNAHLHGCIKKYEVQRRKKGVENSRRKQTMGYSVSLTSSEVKICKTAFLSIHGLQNNRGRVENITKRMYNEICPKKDLRGKHGKHKKKYSDQDLQYVTNFINMLPRYESHYRRNNSGDEGTQIRNI